jgi:hypothetical protein
MQTNKEAREARVRRALAKQSMRVRKSRRRGEPTAGDQGGYMVVDENNYIVNGERFNLTLEDLERWAGTARSRERLLPAGTVNRGVTAIPSAEAPDPSPEAVHEMLQIIRERAEHAHAAQAQQQLAGPVRRSGGALRAFANAFRVPIRRRRG